MNDDVRLLLQTCSGGFFFLIFKLLQLLFHCDCLLVWIHLVSIENPWACFLRDDGASVIVTLT
jgi:hypothetical protein